VFPTGKPKPVSCFNRKPKEKREHREKRGKEKEEREKIVANEKKGKK
jgi:ribosomal protein L23